MVPYGIHKKCNVQKPIRPEAPEMLLFRSLDEIHENTLYQDFYLVV